MREEVRHLLGRAKRGVQPSFMVSAYLGSRSDNVPR